MHAQDANGLEGDVQRRRAARRTALVLSLLAVGVYALFVLQHFL
jgi:hypothetical protein